jgi:cob(I)alamin adenosyltransferase
MLLVDTSRRGLVQIFTGDGKGKTTAALGTVLRASGQGLKVFVVFFIKGHYPHGEFETLPTLPGVKVASFGLRRFIHKQNEVNPEEKAEAQAALAAAREAITGGGFDIVVMDEVNVALFFKLIELEDVLQLINDKPPHVELILTGRRADEKLIEIADLVTEMKNIKHPYEKGIPARKGIEF